ncbi:X-Pro dipeptidyl-peptidase [Spongiactinospora gelatinilytica]|uniref:X-Pro dipeptidyl-peptidase n=1 Tax=Spongiactinospora gelatinilytica TaxID=2666298 RepID=A0A2W2F9X7_9ACTN|nr:CocE/NonD family hydrolase [Spongiactinospora gelatinilytica]PZG21698.1 X-Pro dipeptidyl-peptidase [Spongiactinospora gelatinilytica]
MTLLSRLLGLRPAVRHPVRVRRDVPIPAADGVRLLATHYYPAGVQTPPLVLMRTPYGRGRLVDALPKLLAERGYQVLCQSLRGTAGSMGRFDGFVIDPADADGTLTWLRAQPWFGGVLATWGASYLGYAQWELAAREIPEWKIAVIQDAPSAFAGGFMYPGGAFALGNALGWVQLVDTMFRSGNSLLPQLLAVFGASRRLHRAVLTLPLTDADRALTGHRVSWYQEWLTNPLDNESSREYWARMDHRGNTERMPPIVYLQGGWYDFFLPGMLDDHARLLEAGRNVRLLIGPWSHGKGLNTRVAMRDALTALDVALAGRQALSGVRVFITGAKQWRDLSGWPPAHRPTPWHLHPGGGLSREQAAPGAPPSRYRYDPADPTPTVGGAIVGFSAGPADNRAIEARPDVLTFTTAPLTSDVEVIGPVRVRLYARASLPHVDYTARLCTVDQRGRSVNLCDGIVRLPAPGTGREETAGVRTVDITLWPVAHRFARGHRIRLQVAGGAHPRYGRNPGTGRPLATERELRASDNEILHDPDHPSAIWLPVSSSSTETASTERA